MTFVVGETPEGWYDDPQSSVSGAQRWWNGVQWTAHTRVAEQAMPQPSQAGSAEPDGSSLQLHPRLAELGISLDAVVRTPYGAVMAQPSSRIAGFMADTVITVVVSLVLWLPTLLGFVLVLSFVRGQSTEVDERTVPFWAVAAVVCFCQHAVGLGRRGASRGQRAVGIGVRPWAENRRLSARQVLVRSALMATPFVLAAVTSLTVGLGAFVLLAAPVLTHGRRGAHEMLSDTCTVATR